MCTKELVTLSVRVILGIDKLRCCERKVVFSSAAVLNAETTGKLRTPALHSEMSEKKNEKNGKSKRDEGRSKRNSSGHGKASKEHTQQNAASTATLLADDKAIDATLSSLFAVKVICL